MTIDIFTSTGAKKGQRELSPTLFGGPVNRDLIHQAVVRQESNARTNIAHVKTRGEVVGTTKKAYQQKHTGRARRGALRSPLVRGGGKTFGPRNDRNFIKEMPKAMWRAALRSTLALQARQGGIFGLEEYPETVKTKTIVQILSKMPVEIGRRILFVLPAKHDALYYSSRNIPRTKTILVNYLNPRDVVQSKCVIFVGDSLDKAEQLFGQKPNRGSSSAAESMESAPETKPAKRAASKNAAPKKPASKKKSA
jgi:large subunit ribosomal protein L4